MSRASSRENARLFVAVLVGFLSWPVIGAIKTRRARERMRVPDAEVPNPVDTHEARPQRRSRGRRPTSYVLAGVAMTLLLFGGAALAAGATELVGADTATDTSASTEPAEAGTTTAEPGPVPSETGEVTPPPPPPPPPLPPPAEEPAPAPPPSGPLPPPPGVPGKQPVPIVPPVWLDKPETAALDPETHEASAATIWLYRVLPDPTPPAKRLAPAFARRLSAVARAQRVHWSLLLGVLRASGHEGTTPASARELETLARRLRNAGVRRHAWAGLVAYSGRPAFADQTIALSRYNRAVGLRALVRGLAASKAAFQRRILASRRIELYPLGRADVASGRIDVRVLVLMLYLARTYREVTVSSLQTGHRLFARPGVVSAHVYGLAIDITALGGVSIAGNQRPGGLTERAVRDILLLPAELQPRQVISLLGLGGASFPLADHGDHIHVGY